MNNGKTCLALVDRLYGALVYKRTIYVRGVPVEPETIKGMIMGLDFAMYGDDFTVEITTDAPNAGQQVKWEAAEEKRQKVRDAELAKEKERRAAERAKEQEANA